jgi:hypothetical protein
MDPPKNVLRRAGGANEKSRFWKRRRVLTPSASPVASGAVSGSAKKKRRAVMLGVGLDSDGHKRVTTGPNFALVGGTQDTHEAMTEKVIKINEKLNAKGKNLDTVTSEEFDDVAHEVGLKRRPSDDHN